MVFFGYLGTFWQGHKSWQNLQSRIEKSKYIFLLVFVAFSEYVNFMTQPPFSLHTLNSRNISSLRYLEKSLVNCLWTLSSKNAYLCNPNILRNLLWWFLTQSAVECIKLGHSEVWFFTHLLDLTCLIWQFKCTNN